MTRPAAPAWLFLATAASVWGNVSAFNAVDELRCRDVPGTMPINLS